MYKKKDFTILAVLFHELNHFKMKYDIKLGFLDESLVRVIKEELISSSPLYPSFIKVSEEEKRSSYYKDNYELYSEEKLADFYSLENLLLFLKEAKINLTERQKYEINALFSKIQGQYNNYLRDVSNNLNFNSYNIDFEEAFDILIKNNPQWLEYSQLRIEYFLDSNGTVKKRTSEELKTMLHQETDPIKIKYIEKLLLSNANKKNNSPRRKSSILNQKIDFNTLKISNKL